MEQEPKKRLDELIGEYVRITDEIQVAAPHPISFSMSTKKHYEQRKSAFVQMAAVRNGRRKAYEQVGVKQKKLFEAVRKLRAQHPSKYESALAAATYLIDHDSDGDLWNYEVDQMDPQSRERAIDNLRRRIGRAEQAGKK